MRKDSLMRLKVDEKGRVVRDETGKGEGRGAYVCPSRACLEGLGRIERLKKAFRQKGELTLHPDLIPTQQD